jgi:hypothetical protein
MLARLERLSNQLPPRLKALLNLAITLVLVLLALPYMWSGFVERAWSDLALGIGLLLLGIFNVFT